MITDGPEAGVAGLAAAIGEPARVRMLCLLLDGRARTATELALAAGVAPSTASVHLQRLHSARLVRVMPQGRHRYFSLHGPEVAAALETLSLLAGSARTTASSSRSPMGLRLARTCYDHIAGALGVALYERFNTLGWFARTTSADGGYDLTAAGMRGLEAVGVDVEAARGLRRRFAYPCLDWSERRPHLGGALGAAVLDRFIARRWVVRDLDSRALEITPNGRREMRRHFGLPQAL